MVEEMNKPPTAFAWRAAVTTAVVATAMLGATEAAEAHDWEKRHRRPSGYLVVPPGHARYYAPAPVVYAVPAPVVVYPQPVAYVPLQYAPAYPAYGPPVGSVSFGLTLPLQ